MAVYCNRCGTGQPYTARFCSNCGATIAATPPAPSRPLYRPIQGRAIAGVCMGLALAYGWDVALVRIFSVIGFFFSGGVVAVAYLACWIGIPEESMVMPGGYPPGAGPAPGPYGSGSYTPGSGAYPPNV
jgi:phage shock protein PspC (stress-responsive transcriptional regulator)